MNLRTRVEQLELETPGTVRLYLDDGSTREFPGLKPLEFLLECERQLRAGDGPLAPLLLRAVDAKNCCGQLWRLMQAVWSPVIEAEAQRSATPTTAPDAAPIKAFRVTHSDQCPN